MSKNFITVELYNSYKKQHGNAKNADIKRLIKLKELELEEKTEMMNGFI